MTEDANSFSLDLEPPNGEILTPPILKVYLASALTNLDEQKRQEASMGRKIIRQLLHGYDYGGVRFDVYDPAEVTPPGTTHTEEEVYVTDHHQTSTADLMIFYVLAPSIGVGMEAQISANCTLPRVVVSQRDSAVSRMFGGIFSPTLAHLKYDQVSELEDILSTELLRIAQAAVRSAQRRRSQVEGFCANALGRTMMLRRLSLGLSLEQLAEMTDIRETWLQRIEWIPSLAASVTLIQLHGIATALCAAACVTDDGFPTIRASNDEVSLTPIKRESLENLIESVDGRDHPPGDDRLFSLWQKYCEQHNEELKEAGRHRGAELKPVSVAEWKRRYDARDRRLF